jgi:uncharacterized repeat protein (TIGR03803 family)
MDSPAQNLIVYFYFNVNGTEGRQPIGPLVQGFDGGFYGATSGGGANNAGGTIFKLTTSPKKLTTLYSFCPNTNCTTGIGPTGVIQATDGNFYGTTESGGISNSKCYVSTGCGMIFKITSNGALTTLYEFCLKTNCTDGSDPQGRLVQATDGNFYGTTMFGGTNNSGYCAPYGCGTIFKISPKGALTTLYSFCPASSCFDGEFPTAALVQGTDGNLYGTTSYTIFKITRQGAFTVLYTFCSQFNCADGGSSTAPLLQAADGAFYGTAQEGGANKGGVVFKITASGAYTTLYSFCPQNGCPDGKKPLTELIQATDGNFYGTTSLGGANGSGTIFKITPGGTLTTLASFSSGVVSYPRWMFQATSGVFYPTSYEISEDPGRIYELSEGLGPFVETVPTSGKVGARVKVLGTDLTGTTAVTFNGIAATFTVVSASEITTTVPTGATTGTVEVTTPTGTLSSNVEFRVP